MSTAGLAAACIGVIDRQSMDLLPPSDPLAAGRTNEDDSILSIHRAPSSVPQTRSTRERIRAAGDPEKSQAEHESATQRLLALVPERSPRGKYRVTVEACLPAILTARRNGNSWASIAEIVGIRPDAVRKAVASLIATPASGGSTAAADDRRSTLSDDVPRDAAAPSVPPAAPRPTPPPVTHAGLRRKDARI